MRALRCTGSRRTEAMNSTGIAQQAYLHVGQRPQSRNLYPQSQSLGGGNPMMNNQEFFGCGLLLMVALLGGCASGAPSTTADGEAGYTGRIGGQAGQTEHLEKRTGVSAGYDQDVGRIGGQAGQTEPLEKRNGVTAGYDQDVGRIGGQAGQHVPKSSPTFSAADGQRSPR